MTFFSCGGWAETYSKQNATHANCHKKTTPSEAGSSHYAVVPATVSVAGGPADTAKARRRLSTLSTSGAGFATHTQLETPLRRGFFRDGCERSPSRAVSEIGDGLARILRGAHNKWRNRSVHGGHPIRQLSLHRHPRYATRKIPMVACIPGQSIIEHCCLAGCTNPAAQRRS
jgi:hypothetical protein